MTESSAAGSRTWTSEQQLAIERREGNLLLAAGAGSGKTSVLVERFVASVVRDGIGVGEILTITFTEKAAAEMRDRIRSRLRELGEDQAAAATESAYIATIHGFCARVLRAQALSAGLDPGFTVLDEHEARRLAAVAFEDALEQLASRGGEAVGLIAGYGPDALRAAILSLHAELRSRGQLHPALPPLDPAPELAPAIAVLRRVAEVASAELAAVPKPGVRVFQALERLQRCLELADGEDLWPAALGELALPRGNGAALRTPVCAAYTDALAEVRAIVAHRRVTTAHRLLDELLVSYAANYAARKRAHSALDFEDLELLTARLLATDADLRERYRARFARIMVDELQDTNSVQMGLIDSLARENLFTVGDAQQAIYGFRHADVELFEALADERRQRGQFASLQVNFRSRPEILEVLNLTFAAAFGERGASRADEGGDSPNAAFGERGASRADEGGGDSPNRAGERFAPLLPGRTSSPADEPCVELLLADKGVDWDSDGLASPWRQAEARILAARVAELIEAGSAAREIVVLTRATSDLRTYERALEERGVATYVIGGRGYWGHPQVLDLVAYLEALANPRDEEALYAVLASPFVGVSLDALVVLAAAAKTGKQDPFSVLCAGADELEALEALEALAAGDREALERFAAWFVAERELVPRLGLEELIDRVLQRTGYDLWVLGRAGGRRRLANVRKLMRLAREHESEYGADLRAFLNAITQRAHGSDVRESEAPVEGEALDAVRLMTIHRSKGLEFDTVCVADLGRARWSLPDVMRVSGDGRFGLRLAEPGTGRREPALHYKALGDERQQSEEAEERRLFYVAMTRARERLVLSGAARLESWPDNNGGTPIGWIAQALVPDFAQRIGEGRGVTERGVAFTLVREATEDAAAATPAVAASAAASAAPPVSPPERAAPAVAPPAIDAPLTLSYSALAEYQRCGYRFYAERVLGLPPGPGSDGPGLRDDVPALGAGTQARQRPAAERGILAHALLEALDFRRAQAPSPEALERICAGRGLRPPGEAELQQLTGLVRDFGQSDLCARLAHATQVRREQRFSFALGDELLMTGALDVVARERFGMLVVDYKTDRLGDSSPAVVVARQYATQRLVYALAVLLTGAARVDVAHVFLERPQEPVLAMFTAAERPELVAELEALTADVRARRFEVTAEPMRAVCSGCPAQGGLCSWAVAMTRRERADQLF